MKRRPSGSAGKTRPAPAALPGGNDPAFRRRHYALAAAGFTLAFAALLWPLLAGRVEPRWDARDYFYPSFAYVADSAAEGRFPLWDPYTSCGAPFHAEPQNPTLNPVAVSLGLLVPDSGRAFVAYWALFWWWGGIGAIWLSRLLGAGPHGAFLAAMAYAFSGFFVGQAEHTSYIVLAGWLPWIFGLGDRAAATGNPGYALLAGAALGAASHGGYPGMVAFSGLALAIWLGLRHLPGGADVAGPPAPLPRRIARLAWVLGVAAAVLAAAWSPAVNAFLTEGSGYTERVAGLDPETANTGGPFTLPSFLSLVSPYATILGRPWMGTDFVLTNGYAGILAAPLAAIWFFNGSGKRRPWWILVFAAFMFLASLGGKAGLRTALYYVYPPLRFMRYSAPFRLFWILPLALAAGLGVTAIRGGSGPLRFGAKAAAAWLAVSASGCAAVAAFFGSHGIGWDALPFRLFFPALVLLPSGIAVLVLASRTKDARSLRLASWMILAIGCVDMGFHMHTNRETVWIERDSVRQAESLHARTTEVPGNPGPRLPPLPFGFFNAQQVIKQPVVQGYSTMRSRGFDEVLCSSRFVEVLRSPARFWLSPGVEAVPTENAALSILSDIGIGSPVPALVEEPAAALPASRAVPGTFGAARIVKYSPEKIEMEIEVPGETGAFLASTERFAAGWKASVDGFPGKVVKTNVYFRGLAVPPGRHAVEWTYRPNRWIPLVILGYASLVIAAGAGTFLIARSKRQPGR